MSEVLFSIGEAVFMEVEEVEEVMYSKETANSFTIFMKNGKQYELTVNETYAKL